MSAGRHLSDDGATFSRNFDIGTALVARRPAASVLRKIRWAADTSDVCVLRQKVFRKGFGFIREDGATGDAEIFFHINNVIGDLEP